MPRPTDTRPSSRPRDQELQNLAEWQRRLSLLLDYSRRMAEQRDREPLLRLITDAAREILQAERCTIFILDKKRQELWSRVATGDQMIRVPVGKGIVGEALFQRRLINIPDAYADARFNPAVDQSTGFRTRNLLTAPLTPTHGDPLGALQVLNKKGGAFGEDDEKMMILFAGQAASAVENAQLYEELQAAHRDTVFRLAAAAEFKDEDTRNHLERVSRFSALIAEALKKPEEWCRRLLLASPMHDIGKLGVPDAILQKPGRLNDVEWEQMKRHPTYGAEILANSESELMMMSERIARAHHEKWDGSGYPLGLKGEDIPLEARLVALADVFDALTSARCYKPAFTLEDALAIIEEGAGKHFDPDVVEAFRKALPEIIQVMKRFVDAPAAAPRALLAEPRRSAASNTADKK